MNRLFILLLLILSGGCLAIGLGCRQNSSEHDRRTNSAGIAPGAAATASSDVIDSLKALVAALKPGLGEFMIQLKYHHDRLGEAIAAKDYVRAAYEADEMKETAEKIVQLHISNDKLQQPFVAFYDKYLQSPLSVLAVAASKKDGAALRTNFIVLTSNCNSCHHANNMSFMKIE